MKKKKIIERKISIENARENAYNEYMMYDRKELKNKLVQLVNLKIDTEIAIQGLTDALFSKGDCNWHKIVNINGIQCPIDRLFGNVFIVMHYLMDLNRRLLNLEKENNLFYMRFSKSKCNSSKRQTLVLFKMRC